MSHWRICTDSVREVSRKAVSREDLLMLLMKICAPGSPLSTWIWEPKGG